MRERRIILVGAILTALAAGLYGCAEAPVPTPERILETVEVQVVETVEVPVGPAEPEGPSGQIILYTSVPLDIINEIRADFMAAHPEIKLEIFRGKTGDVMARVNAETKAGEVIADLLWVAEPSTYEVLKEQGVFLKFTPAEMEALPEEMCDPDGYYYAGRLINMVLAYNTTLVTTPPSSWKDLLDPAYEGRLGFATTTAGSALATVGMMATDAQFGWGFLEDLKANGAVQVANNSTVRENLSTGEFMVGWVLDYMIRQAKESGSPVDYVWPTEGAAFIPSPIAIFNSSDNPEAAMVFVDYVLSKDGQQTLVEKGNFIPVRGDVDPPAGAPGLNDIARLAVDWAWIAGNQEQIKDSFVAIFGD